MSLYTGTDSAGMLVVALRDSYTCSCMKIHGSWSPGSSAYFSLPPYHSHRITQLRILTPATVQSRMDEEFSAVEGTDSGRGSVIAI